MTQGLRTDAVEARAAEVALFAPSPPPGRLASARVDPEVPRPATRAQVRPQRLEVRPAGGTRPAGRARRLDQGRVVCGVDVGSLRTPAYVAWLRDGGFVLDLYQPSVRDPLPSPPPGWEPPTSIALDAPQGLPAAGAARRTCDRDANTPTRRLPASRSALESASLYRELVRAGVDIFWAVCEQGLARVAGLSTQRERLTTIAETYPRYVLRRLWPDLWPIPSKRQAPLAYVEAVNARLSAAGYTCASVVRPSVDQVDAMLCALAAEAMPEHRGCPPGTVGEAPVPDTAEGVLREGFIVAP